jgi:hypothetical protein
MTFPRNKVFKGHSVPYGTLAGASYELRQCYYYLGYKNDHDMPELPSLPADVEEPVNPEDVLESRDIIELLYAALDTLTPRQAKVLKLRFGIGVHTDYTLEEVGAVFDVTKERIRQIEAKALRHLRHPSRSSDLRMAFDLDTRARANMLRLRREAIEYEVKRQEALHHAKLKKAQRDAHA